MDKKEFVTQTVQSFIDIIDYAIDFTVTYDEAEDVFLVDMKGENLGALIGFHGRNISSVELMINLMLNSKKSDTTGDDRIRAHVDINRYIFNRFETIKRIATEAINKVQKSGDSYTLPPMNPYERLYIHNFISKYQGMTSESTGEEPRRAITIKMKGDTL